MMPYKGENMIITVGAEKGGVAKTRLATHIATLAAKRQGLEKAAD